MNRIARAAILALLVSLLVIQSGCSLLGIAAARVGTAKIRPSYTGFQGQSIAVMVWADRAMRIDHPALQLDVSTGVVAKLRGAQTSPDYPAVELAGATFPADKGPSAMIAFQKNNPLYDSSSIADIAPKLGVSRLIYIEVEDFTLHPDDVIELDRGALNARIRVVEVANGKGKVAFSDTVAVTFPPGSDMGRAGLGEKVTYQGTVELFTEEVMKKFVTYEEGL